MLHHLGAVVRGKSAWVMVDMPYNSANDPFTPRKCPDIEGS